MDQSGNRETELLESQEAQEWRDKLLAAGLGLLTAGPVGLLASIAAFDRVKGSWLPWALIGVVVAPPLAYGQWVLVRMLQEPGPDAEINAPLAARSISEADRAARACALALKNNSGSDGIRNPIDGRELFCDRSHPTTVVITSQRFSPLDQPRSCGGSTLRAGTQAAQWLVSPAGTLVCQAVGEPRFWWSREAINRAELYRRCTENLHLEAQTNFLKSAHQLGRRDYCAEERALLAQDQITNQS